MKRYALVLAAVLALAFPGIAFAQSGGLVTVGASDSSTAAAVTQVGDATNKAIRVNIVAGAGSGGTATADGAAETQGTTNTTPASGLFITSYSAATTGHAAIWRMTSGGSGYVNLDTIGATAVVTGGAGGLLAVGGPVASGSSNADNPIKEGAVFNTTQPTVTTGQIVDIQATARGAQIVAPGVDGFAVTVSAGSAVIGHVIADSGSTTVVTGTSTTNQVTACGATINDFEAQLTAATLTTVTSTTQCVDSITLANISAAAVTLLAQDQSTVCNGTFCQFVPTTTIPPGSVISIPLNGTKFTSGIKLTASAANAIQYAIHSRQ